MSFDPWLKAATSHIETVRVGRTGINPLLWIVGLMALPAMLLSAWVGDGWLRIALFSFAAALTLIAIITYIVILLLRPELLQSEEYRLKRYALLKIYSRGASPEVLEATSELARLESGSGKARNEDKP